MNNKTGYIGVTYFEKRNEYRTCVFVGRSCITIGYFGTAIEAAIAYDNYVLEKYPNTWKRLNFPKEPPIIIPNTRWLPISNGMFTLVDEDRYEECAKHKWCVAIKNTHGKDACYVYRKKIVDGKKITEMLHDFINGKAKSGYVTDHKNQNTLDHRFDNLRECTPSQNCMNRGKQRNNTTGFKGVWYHKQNKKYCADIWVLDRKYGLGSYITKEEAARAYDFWAAYYHKEFAEFNFKDEIIKMLN